MKARNIQKKLAKRIKGYEEAIKRIHYPNSYKKPGSQNAHKG